MNNPNNNQNLIVPRSLFEEMHKYLTLYGLLHDIGSTEMFNTILKQTEEIMAHDDNEPEEVVFFVHFKSERKECHISEIVKTNNPARDFYKWLELKQNEAYIDLNGPAVVTNCNIIR